LDSWAVNGAQSSARIARLQLQSATRSGNGIVESGDMEVRELDVPGPAVRVVSGAAVALGREAVFQGSYYAFNVGDAEVPITQTGSGGGRSDLVIMRVEDPNIDGTSWAHDPATDPVYYFRVLEGVDPATTEVPAGTTGVALARIDIPASTATITQDMITDLRQMLNPRSETVVRVQRGVEPIELLGNVTTYFENAPNLVWPQITIPTWATQVQMIGHWENMFQSSEDLAAGSGSTDARGQARLALGYGTGGGPTDIQTSPIAYNFNLNVNNGERRSFGLADQQLIPSEMRGQPCNLRMQVQGTEGVRGRLRCDAWSNYYVQLVFLELAVADVD
jgi:hypothetical protein